ncbi:MAG: SH3 domain-containing protein, partial [Caldilineaceae bacterium]
MSRHFRASWLGVIVAATITFAGCYPFQGDISLLLTPVPVDPTRQAEILEALNKTQIEAIATAESMSGEMESVTATVSANSLRVRQDADPDSPIVAGLRQSDSVKIVARSEDGTWLQVQIPDVDTLGWIAAEFVTVDGDVMALPVAGEMTAEEPTTGGENATPVAEETATPAAGEMATEKATLTLNVDPASLQIVDGELTIPSITSSSAGWLVVHADDGGTFGPVIGYAALAEGENTDVVVPIDTDAATETVHLMLHEDAGVVGTYEFPGADVPVMVDGAPLSMAYSVGAPVVSEATATPTVAPTAAPTVEPTTAPTTESTVVPTTEPTTAPTTEPTAAPTVEPTVAPTTAPAAEPTAASTIEPTVAPTVAPTLAPPATPAATPAVAGGEPAMPVGEAAAMTGITSAELATVNTRSARVRSGPMADAPIVGGALAGEVYPVAEKSADGQWVRIYFPGTDGQAWVG